MCTSSRLFHKRVTCSKFTIYVFMTAQGIISKQETLIYAPSCRAMCVFDSSHTNNRRFFRRVLKHSKKSYFYYPQTSIGVRHKNNGHIQIFLYSQFKAPFQTNITCGNAIMYNILVLCIDKFRSLGNVFSVLLLFCLSMIYTTVIITQFMIYI